MSRFRVQMLIETNALDALDDPIVRKTVDADSPEDALRKGREMVAEEGTFAAAKIYSWSVERVRN